ncbi:MAG TPA: hypothetical protein VJB65_04390, partial [Patescibacteria group bacterium]|nr:hypothetical protein [Patescibacteria group bacterium]
MTHGSEANTRIRELKYRVIEVENRAQQDNRTDVEFQQIATTADTLRITLDSYHTIDNDKEGRNFLDTQENALYQLEQKLQRLEADQKKRREILIQKMDLPASVKEAYQTGDEEELKKLCGLGATKWERIITDALDTQIRLQRIDEVAQQNAIIAENILNTDEARNIISGKGVQVSERNFNQFQALRTIHLESEDGEILPEAQLLLPKSFYQGKELKNSKTHSEYKNLDNPQLPDLVAIYKQAQAKKGDRTLQELPLKDVNEANSQQKRLHEMLQRERLLEEKSRITLVLLPAWEHAQDPQKPDTEKSN